MIGTMWPASADCLAILLELEYGNLSVDRPQICGACPPGVPSTVVGRANPGKDPFDTIELPNEGIFSDTLI